MQAVSSRGFAFAVWTVTCRLSSSNGFQLPFARRIVSAGAALSPSSNLSSFPFISSSLAMSTSTEKTVSSTIVDEGTKDKLALLRERMRELDLDVYIIPTDDPHLSGEF